MSDASWAVYVNGSLAAPGDYLTDFRGDEWIYDYVSREPNHTGTAKLLVHHADQGYEREFYHHIFNGVKVERLLATEEEYILRLLEPPRHFA